MRSVTNLRGKDQALKSKKLDEECQKFHDVIYERPLPYLSFVRAQECPQATLF